MTAPFVVHVVLWGSLLLAAMVAAGVMFAAVVCFVALRAAFIGAVHMSSEKFYWLRVIAWLLAFAFVASMLFGCGITCDWGNK